MVGVLCHDVDIDMRLYPYCVMYVKAIAKLAVLNKLWQTIQQQVCKGAKKKVRLT